MCDYPTYFSMVIAALTLIATIAVAYLIYVDQQHRAKEQYGIMNIITLGISVGSELSSWHFKTHTVTIIQVPCIYRIM